MVLLRRGVFFLLPQRLTAALHGMSSDLLARIIGILMGTDRGSTFRRQWQLWGYVVVGSKALLGHCDAEQDTDVVLLSETNVPAGSTTYHCQSDAALSELAINRVCPLVDGFEWVLRKEPDLRDASVWFVNATVNVVKVCTNDDSVDVLWLSGGGQLESTSGPSHRGCTLKPPAPTVAIPGLAEYKADNLALILPMYGGMAVECIHLGRIFLQTLRTSGTFSTEALCRVRAFAKRRHVYGSKYGFPPVWVRAMARARTRRVGRRGPPCCGVSVCGWTNNWPRSRRHPNHSAAGLPADRRSAVLAEEVVQRFLTVLSLWPWPLPWTYQNMQSIVDRTHVDASALQARRR